MAGRLMGLLWIIPSRGRPANIERSSEDEELIRRYEDAREADASGTLVQFASREEYRRLLSQS